MPRAIVTFGRGWQALAVVRSLGRQGIEVVVGEETRFAPCFFSKYATATFLHPSPANEPGPFLDRLLEVVKEHAPDDPDDPYVLIPVHKETWLIAEHRERFEPHVRMALAPHEDMKLVHDKGRLPQLATELGIPIPETLLPRSIEEVYRVAPGLAYPQFLKVREGAAGVGIEKVDDADALIRSFKRFVEGYGLEPDRYPLVQAAVPGRDYCVTALFDRGEPVASMTYRNIRAFPRDTGAGSLRETVRFEEGEAAAERLLRHLGWHGIAELDFRKDDRSPPYLIEVNPRIFGGMPQSLAANVDYPHLLFRIASGEEVGRVEVGDRETRTETPVTGLLATLDEIAHDPARLAKLRRLKEEAGTLARSDVRRLDFGPFFRALKDVVDPKDIRRTIREKLEVHQGTIDDVLQADDPKPVMGFLFPLALMLKHGKLSMGVLTSEAELETERPRRRLRDLLRRPTWGTILLAFLLFAVCVFLQSWDVTASNVGRWAALPQRIAEAVFGEVHDASTPLGALATAGYHALNFVGYYFLAALILRQRKATA
jgi:predicted ATP-grasp superfamily ATP-dependent carboligase